MTRNSSLSDMSLKQLNEMNDKAQKLCELMKRGIVEFIFKKKSTGKLRRAKGTLKRDLIPPGAQRKRGRPKKRPEDLVIYFDVEKHDIRSFKDYLLQKVFKRVEKPTKTSKQNLIDKNTSSSSKKTARKTDSKNEK